MFLIGIIQKINKDWKTFNNMIKEERIAEFIGIMLGDGHIGIYDTKQNKKIYQLKVSLDSRNVDYTNYVRGLMKEIFELEPKVFYKKKENAVDIKIYKKEKVFYAIDKLGLKLSPKMNTAEIPDKYSKGKIALYVLRGLFDTDGSITVFNNNGKLYPRIEIRISPSPMQNQFIDILKEHKINHKIQRLDGGKIKIRINGVKELSNWLEKVGSSNEQYLQKAEKFLKRKVYK